MEKMTAEFHKTTISHWERMETGIPYFILHVYLLVPREYFFIIKTQNKVKSYNNPNFMIAQSESQPNSDLQAWQS